LLISWIILGSYALSFIHIVLFWVYLISVSFGVYFILRKKCCKTCFYCKGCTVGFGKLPELFFRKDGTDNVTKNGVKTFFFLFPLMSLLPAILVSVSIIENFSYEKLVVLILIMTFSLWSIIVRKNIILKKIHLTN